MVIAKNNSALFLDSILGYFRSWLHSELSMQRRLSLSSGLLNVFVALLITYAATSTLLPTALLLKSVPMLPSLIGAQTPSRVLVHTWIFIRMRFSHCFLWVFEMW